MNAKDYLLTEFSDLFEGETRAGQLCPACKGGRTGEGSLSISNREGVLLWTCHRASCAFTGSSAGAPRTARLATEKESCRGVVGRFLAREAQSVPEETCDYLLEKYAITRADIAKWELGWLQSEGRLSLPVFSPDRETCGVNLRSLSGEKPKSKLHTEDGVMAWYPKRGSQSIIIVEDQFSAIRASEYLTAVALLGTNFNEERARFIKKQTPGYVRYMALDQDAFEKSVSFAVQFRGLLGLRVLRLTKDIKDLTNEELAEFMSDNVST